MSSNYTPPDPADEETRLPPSRLRRDGPAISLTGLGARIVATVLVIALGIIIIYVALRPSPEEALPAAPTIDTAQLEPDPAEPLVTFTPGATSTPPPIDEPTPAPADPAAPGAPSALTVGSSAVVTGTNGLGVNLRASNSTGGAVLEILSDATPLTVVEGPTEAEEYIWWKVRTEGGVEGWVVEEYLAP